MEITKEDFENAILVATSSQSEVFDSVEPHFVEVYERLQQQFLGYAGEAALESNERLTSAVIRAVCLAPSSKWSVILTWYSRLPASESSLTAKSLRHQLQEWRRWWNNAGWHISRQRAT